MRIEDRLKGLRRLRKTFWFSVAIYLALLVVVVSVSQAVFSYFGLLHTSSDTARILLNTLVNSEAGIFAIVVTLALLAVQLSASSYSARVIDLFMRTPDPWMLMIIYIVAMVYGLGVLKLVDASNIAEMEVHISMSFFLGIYAFLALIIFIWNTFGLLQPFTIIDKLSDRISRQHILSFVSRDNPFNNDPVQPIIDIVLGSWGKYDYETLGYGLRSIGARLESLVVEDLAQESERCLMADHVCSHFFRIGSLALVKKDEDFVMQIMLNLDFMGSMLAKQGLEESVLSILNFVGNTGISAAGQKMERTAFEAARCLKSLGTMAAGCQLEDASRAGAYYLSEVGIESAEQEMENTAAFAMTNLEALMDEASERGMEEVAKLCQTSITEVREALDLEEASASQDNPGET